MLGVGAMGWSLAVGVAEDILRGMRRSDEKVGTEKISGDGWMKIVSPKRQSALKYGSAMEGCSQQPGRMVGDKNPESDFTVALTQEYFPQAVSKTQTHTRRLQVAHKCSCGLVLQSALIKNKARPT